MTIKDVEKLTGLSAKGIRYYESKGLLRVERSEGNDYRQYTEENVRQLRWIRLLRYLDFSVSQVREILSSDEKTVRAKLEERAEEMEKERMDCVMKQGICQELKKDYADPEKWEKDLEECNNTIEFMEGGEMQEFKEGLLDASCPSLSITLLWTLWSLGPILNVIICLDTEKYEGIGWGIALSLLDAVILTLIWKNYLEKRKNYGRRVKERNARTKYVIPLMILGFVMSFPLFASIAALQESLLAPEGWLFYDLEPWAEDGMICLVMVPLVVFFQTFRGGLLQRRQDRESCTEEEKTQSARIWRRVFPVLVTLWLLLFYASFTSVNFVTEETIVHHSPLHPAGETYSYEEVEKVKASFGSKAISLWSYQRRGNFSYTVYVGGHVVIFRSGSANEKIERYEEDTYLWLEELDEALMMLDIPKESDVRYSSSSDLAEYYVERFLRIAGAE